MFKNTNQKSSMECEIFEQPEILSNILNTYVDGEVIKITLPENINKVYSDFSVAAEFQHFIKEKCKPHLFNNNICVIFAQTYALISGAFLSRKLSHFISDLLNPFAGNLKRHQIRFR